MQYLTLSRPTYVTFFPYSHRPLSIKSSSSLMVDASDATIAVAVPKGTCIPFQIGRAFRSVKLKLSPRPSTSSSSKQKHHLAGKEPKIVYSDESSSSSIDFESITNKELLGKEDSMNGIHRRCRYQSNRLLNGGGGHYSSPLPRNGSRSKTPTPATPSSSSLLRDRSGRRAFSGPLARKPSQRSSTPIMFSNSTGILKAPALEKNLDCTLEELCYGCTKKIKFTRDVLINTGETVQEEELLTINVKPGWKKGTKITFEGMGNQRLGMQPSDVTFIIAEKRHPLFRRDGDDLELALEIPLVKALTGCNLSVPLLGGTKMRLKIDDIVHPGFETVIEGQGMPISMEMGKRGNLRVVFLVAFPKDLKDEKRFDAVKILQGSS